MLVENIRASIAAIEVSIAANPTSKALRMNLAAKQKLLRKHTGELAPKPTPTKLEKVDWIPAGRYWYEGVLHKKNTYATFTSDIGRIRIEIPDHTEARVFIGYTHGKHYKARSRFWANRIEVATLLYYTNAVQNPRSKKDANSN